MCAKMICQTSLKLWHNGADSTPGLRICTKTDRHRIRPRVKKPDLDEFPKKTWLGQNSIQKLLLTMIIKVLKIMRNIITLS